MKAVRSIALIVISLVVVSSCFEPPVFSNKPKIRIEDITFINGPPNNTDTLKLTIFFRDGDGNLGLRPEEIDEPFNAYTWFLDKDGELINANQLEVPEPGMKITTKHSIQDRVIANTNSFTPPNDCLNYRVDSVFLSADYAYLFDSSYKNVTSFTSDGNLYYKVIDTLYVEPNRNHYNIDVSIWVQCCQGGGTGCCPEGVEHDEDGYYLFEFPREAWPVCGEGFNGRFPYIARDSETPMEGTISYSLKSIGFESDLGGTKRIRLKVKVRDRALNESNEVISDSFLLSEKTR